MSLNSLLSRGYFPKELPNPFITESFANVITSNSSSLPGDLNAALSAKKPNTASVSKPCRYSHARGGLARRHLSIPNPVHFSLLCTELIQNWNDLAALVTGSKFSATTPTLSKEGRALQGKHPKNRQALARQTRLSNRYILQTDITRFYPSIYTHSLPWAIHSKVTAKKNRKHNLIGNRIDSWVRMAQDGQTVGVPVGPDTSLLLAEIILHRCDEELAAKLPNTKGHRFIDDYELGFRDRSAAEDAFHLLESCLAEFELALNTGKTRVVNLPLPTESLGIATLRNFNFRTKGKSSDEARDIQLYFDKLFDLYNSGADEHLINYGIARLRSQTFQEQNWHLVESLLLLCIAPEPASLPYVLEIISVHGNAGAKIDRDEFEAMLNTLIVEHVSLGHSSEVAWALWGCLALNLQLHSNTVSLLQKSDDPVIALLSLDCERRGLNLSAFDKTLWESLMVESSLYDEHWLLAYEANVKGWLQGNGKKDFVASDKNFGFLKSNGVYFYDEKRAVSPPGQTIIPKPPAASLTLPEDFEGYGLTNI